MPSVKLLRHRHSWPGPTLWHKKSDESLRSVVDENPFAFFITPTEGFDSSHENYEDESAGIDAQQKYSPISQSRSPFRRKVDQDISEETSVSKAGRTPTAVVRRWKGI